MPKRVLGSDPFARSGSRKKAAAQKRAAQAEEAAEGVSTGDNRMAGLTRAKLLEPSRPGSEGTVEQRDADMSKKKARTVVRKTRKQPAKGQKSKTGEKTSGTRGRRTPSETASTESATSEEGVSTQSDEGLSSNGDGEHSLFNRLFDIASPRRMRKLLGALRLRERSEEVDDFGKDPIYSERIEPLFTWLYEKYWRVEVEGIKNVPEKGRALLVANHSGMLPFDGIMISQAVHRESRSGRDVRFLVEDMFSALPFLSPFLARIGGARACQENAERLLHEGELVCVFPEGVKGTGKHFRQRYQLQRFGRGGFVRLCMRTKTPLVPVAVVGAEEIYPMVALSERLGKLVGLPYFPVTPTWPLLGLFGLVPLPSKWHIRFGRPIRFDKYGKEATDDEILVNKVKEGVRDSIQEMINQMLEKRESVWFG